MRRPAPGAPLTAADLMVRGVITIAPETPVEEVSELFQIHNINGAPVVDESGKLVGILTEDDLVFGQFGLTEEEMQARDRERAATSRRKGKGRRTKAGGKAGGKAVRPGPARRAAEIMTPNPITAEEATSLDDLCRIMWNLRIHRVPIVRRGILKGIVSSMDICRLIAEGKARLDRGGD
jgi:CBS domain-containing protein